MYKTISFDFWGTLAKNNPEFRAASANMLRDILPQLKLSDDTIASTRKEVKDYFDTLVETWGIQPPVEVMMADWLHRMFVSPKGFPGDIITYVNREYQAVARDYPALPYSEDTGAILKDLSKNSRLILISNTLFVSGETMRHWLKGLGWDEYFHQMIFSDEVGLSKPHPRIFEQYSGLIDIHVGDNPHTDGLGAKNSGIDFIGINGNFEKTLKDVYPDLATATLVRS